MPILQQEYEQARNAIFAEFSKFEDLQVQTLQQIRSQGIPSSLICKIDLLLRGKVNTITQKEAVERPKAKRAGLLSIVGTAARKVTQVVAVGFKKAARKDTQVVATEGKQDQARISAAVSTTPPTEAYLVNLIERITPPASSTPQQLKDVKLDEENTPSPSQYEGRMLLARQLDLENIQVREGKNTGSIENASQSYQYRAEHEILLIQQLCLMYNKMKSSQQNQEGSLNSTDATIVFEALQQLQIIQQLSFRDHPVKEEAPENKSSYNMLNLEIAISDATEPNHQITLICANNSEYLVIIDPNFNHPIQFEFESLPDSIDSQWLVMNKDKMAEKAQEILRPCYKNPLKSPRYVERTNPFYQGMKSQQNGFCTFTSVNLAQQVILRRLLKDRLKLKYPNLQEKLLNQKEQYLFKQLSAETCDHLLQAAKTCLLQDKAENYKPNQYTRRICKAFYWLCSFVPINFSQDFLNKRVLNALYSDYRDAKKAAGASPAPVVETTMATPVATTVNGNIQDLGKSQTAINGREVDTRKAALRAVIEARQTPQPAQPDGPDPKKKEKTGWWPFSQQP